MTRRLVLLVAALAALAAPAWALDAPHGAAMACDQCHASHGASYPSMLKTLCSYCHYDGGPATGVATHSSRTTSPRYGNWDLDCSSCHDPHTQQQDRAHGTTYGKYIRKDLRAQIKEIAPGAPGPYYPALSTLRTVTSSSIKFTSSTEFVDVDAPSPAATDDDICQVCHVSTKYYNTGAQADVHADFGAGSQPGGRCTTCHPHAQGFKAAGGSCDGCHGAPPANGTHLVHAGSGDVPTAYGSLDARGNATSYAYNCGFCHPLDESKHRNGVVDVELYNAAAPPAPTDPTAAGDRRAMKGENPAAAYTPGTTTYTGETGTFTNGTCANVYCHSEQVERAPTVPYATANPSTFVWQQLDPFMNAGANQCCSGTADDYPDFALTVAREYRSPAWVGETHTGADRCGHCHRYPPRNDYPANAGMAGDSHAGLSDWGYEDGHFWNMANGWPIQCRRCHATTVANYLADADWSYLAGADAIEFKAPMAIGDYTTHVNGKKDVAFDYSPAGCATTPNDPQMRYGRTSYGPKCLTTATYNPATRTCANVECHLAQTSVTWGKPYRWGVTSECNACHDY